MGIDYNTCELCNDSYYEGERIEIENIGSFYVCSKCGDILYEELFPCPYERGSPSILVTVPDKEPYTFQFPEAAAEWGEKYENEDIKVEMIVDGEKRIIDGTDDAVCDVYKEGRKRKRTIQKWRPTLRCIEIISDYNTKKMQHYIELDKKLKRVKENIKDRIEDEVYEATCCLQDRDDESECENLPEQSNEDVRV